VAVCETRDPKGLYKKARAALAEGRGMGFTGVDDPYEPPLAPELVLHNDRVTPQEAAAQVINYLEARGLLPDLPR
jgi:adenylylsulfate kinase